MFTAMVLASAAFPAVPARGGPLEDEASELERRFPAATPDEREKILHRLGEIGPEARAAIPLLIQQLNSNDLSDAAAQALAGMQGESAAVVARQIADRQLQINHAVWSYESLLIHDAGPLVEQAAANLASENTIQQYIAASTLREVPFWPDPAVPALFDTLQDDDGMVRCSAVQSLAEHGSAAVDSISTLAQLAESDPDPLARVEALRSLARLDSTGEVSIPTLMRALANVREEPLPAQADQPVQALAAEELSRIALLAENAIPELLTRLNTDLEWHTIEQFRNITYVLSFHPDAARPAIPFLREQVQRDLQLENSSVKFMWIYSHRSAYFERMFVRVAAAAALAAIDPTADDAIRVLIEALEDDRWAVWGRGLGGSFGPILEPRMIAAEGLGHVGSRARAAVPVLRRILDQRRPGERYIFHAKAAWALAQLDRDDEISIEVLAQYMQAPFEWDSPFYREDVHCIAEVLGDRLLRLVPVAISWSRTRAHAERDFFVSLIVRAGDAAIVKLVESMLALDEDIVGSEDQFVARSLGRDAAPALLLLLDRLKSSNHRVRAEAAWLLGEIQGRGAESVPVLTAAVHDERILVRARAANALGRIGVGAVSAAEELRLRLNDDSPWVRSEAEAALARIAPKSD